MLRWCRKYTKLDDMDEKLDLEARMTTNGDECRGSRATRSSCMSENAPGGRHDRLLVIKLQVESSIQRARRGNTSAINRRGIGRKSKFANFLIEVKRSS